jgi:hypothetical protein
MVVGLRRNYAMNTKKDDWRIIDDCFEERAAILEYDAHFSRYEAEQKAAQMMGYSNKSVLKKHVQELKAKKHG